MLLLGLLFARAILSVTSDLTFTSHHFHLAADHPRLRCLSDLRWKQNPQPQTRQAKPPTTTTMSVSKKSLASIAHSSLDPSSGEARFSPGVYYPPGAYYQYNPQPVAVIDPYTTDVLNVYREPPPQAFYNPALQWPQNRTNYLPNKPQNL